MLSEFGSMLPYLKRYRVRYLSGLALLVVVDAAQVFVPRLLKRAVDLIASPPYERRSLLLVLASIVAMAVVISVSRFLWRFLLIGASRHIETELRDRFFEHILLQGNDFFATYKTGDLMARATSDVGYVRQSLGIGLVSFVDAAFMATMILVAMFTWNPEVAAYAVLPMPLITIVILFFGKLVGGGFRKVQEAYSSLSDMAQETIAGIRVVKTFVKEDHFAGRFERGNERYASASMGLVKVFGFFFPLVSFLAGLSTLLLMAAGGRAVLANSLTPGDLVAMIAYLEMLVWPLMGAGFTVNILQRGAASMRRLKEIFDWAPAVRSPDRPVTATPSSAISIRGLSVSYPGRTQPVLEALDIEIPEGTVFGVMGRIGSGKSTLLKTLPRLVDPPPGTVFLGGVDVRDYDLAVLRKSFGFVPQDSFLFSESIEANIRYGDPALEDGRFASILSAAALDREIAGFHDGAGTMVGEKGLTLSGGQKQRIAIARALAADPPILVLDDSLSAVDSETEERILDAVLARRSGRTTLLVSNRVSTLGRADHVVVLDSGRIVQSGSPRCLMEDPDGYYAEIARLQELESGIRGAPGPGDDPACREGG